MFRKRIPLFYVLTVTVVSCGISAGAVWVGRNNKTNEATKDATIQQEEQKCAYNTQQLGGYHYIRPVYQAEKECEPSYMLSIKASIDNYVQAMKNNGLSTASVCLRNLQNTDWMTYNDGERYHPGSMFKIVTMMTLFRTAATEPGFLNTTLTLPVNCPKPPVQTFNTENIKPGGTYKVKELIRNMVVHSDNYATMLLHDVTNQDIFKKTFSDLGLTPPDVHATDYTLSSSEFSRFIGALYDGRYLSLPASETAIALLCESQFQQGFRRFLPPNVVIAHKFGEAGKPGRQELHETAIVYLNEKPYLLTVMTKGSNSQMLADVLAQISKIVYDNMTVPTTQTHT